MRRITGIIFGVVCIGLLSGGCSSGNQLLSGSDGMSSAAEREEMALAAREFSQFQSLTNRASAILRVPAPKLVVLESNYVTTREGYKTLTLAAAIRSKYFVVETSSFLQDGKVLLQWDKRNAIPQTRRFEDYINDAACGAEKADTNDDFVISTDEAVAFADKTIRESETSKTPALSYSYEDSRTIGEFADSRKQ